ncbi:MAG: hypothetical protein H5U06_05475 [Candidatus Aminicenantes bacterium]|nr:hypothetical protein [Candidatus Aminicenantes bacterium]
MAISIGTIIGARPQFIKAAAIIRMLLATLITQDGFIYMPEFKLSMVDVFCWLGNSRA